MEHTPAVGGTDTLVDIRDVTVDRELSREDRIAEFVRQIKNPYRFKCGQFTVHAGGMYQRNPAVSRIFFSKGLTFPRGRGRIEIGKGIEYGIATLLELRGFFCAKKGVFFYAGLQDH